jgi:hypothetical protein
VPQDLLLTLTPLSNGIGNGGSGGNPPPSHLVVSSDFKAPNPPLYTNGSLAGKKPNHANGLQLQGKWTFPTLILISYSIL